MRVEQHLQELTSLVLSGGDLEAARAYLETYDIDVEELLDAAAGFLSQREFVLKYGNVSHEVMVTVGLPSFIIGVLVGLKHGVMQVPFPSTD